jgi:hypothetical protein
MAELINNCQKIAMPNDYVCNIKGTNVIFYDYCVSAILIF